MNGKDLGEQPAAPTAGFNGPNDRVEWPTYGMTKREAFAMAAMQGCLAYSYCNPASGNYHENSDPAGVAKSAIAYADALLAELDKQP